jgi:hypothetical protein
MYGINLARYEQFVLPISPQQNQELGWEKLVEQMDYISSALDTGKTAVEAV